MRSAFWIALFLTTGLGLPAHADDTKTMLSESLRAASSPSPIPPASDPAFDAAIAACGASVVKDARGGPDRFAMDACMAAKGFKPSMPPPPATPGELPELPSPMIGMPPPH
jgi:hypothetical protein